jgi:ubiquitin-protein ligase
MRTVITGASDTPYSFGCFLFEIVYHDTFPNAPPEMKILTNGGNKVRFNPNLYNNGFVCLSLLDTWSGGAGENWDPATTNILHILMSI